MYNALLKCSLGILQGLSKPRRGWRSFAGLGVGKGVYGAVRARAFDRLWERHVAVYTENSGTNLTQQTLIPHSTDRERAGNAPRWVQLGVPPESQGDWVTLWFILCLCRGPSCVQVLCVALRESFCQGRRCG